MKEINQDSAQSKYYYGTKSITIALNEKSLGEDPEDHLTIAEGFIRHNFDEIRTKSRFPLEGYSVSWIQMAIFRRIHVIIDRKLIKQAVKSVRRKIKSYKQINYRFDGVNGSQVKKGQARSITTANNATQTDFDITSLINL